MNKVTKRLPCGCLHNFELKPRGDGKEDFNLTISQCPTHANAHEIAEALVKLWKHTPKIDNGRCLVCRRGYVDWIYDKTDPTNMNVVVGPCSDKDCLSHVITAALTKAGRLE